MLRDIATVMRGAVIAQGLGVLALPLLSRLFSPDAFGHLQLYQSVLAVLLVFPTLRYEVAVLRAKEGEEFRAVAQLSILIVVATTIIAALALVLGSLVSVVKALGQLDFPPLLFLVAMLFGGLLQLMTLVVTRQKAYSASANSKVIQSCTYVGAGLGLGVLAPFSWALVLTDCLGRVASSLFLLGWARRHIPDLWKAVGLAGLSSVMKRYREYPLISVPGTLVNVLGGTLTSFMMYAVFSPSISGQYGLLDRSALLPIGLVILSVSQVFTAQFASALRANDGAAQLHFRRTVRMMALVGMGPALIVVLFGPQLFSLVFGEQWRLAGQFAQFMAPAFWSMLISGPVNMTLTVMGHQKTQMAWEVARLAAMSILWFAVLRFDLSPLQAIAGHSAVQVITNLAFIALSAVMLDRDTKAREMVKIPA